MNMDTRASVSIVRCESYEEAKLYEAVAQVAREGGMPDVAGKTILLKPNILSDSNPEDCITTNPEFVRATIKLLKNCGAKEIHVGDSPGLHSPTFEGKRCGIKDVCDQEGAIWEDFTKNPTEKPIKGTGRQGGHGVLTVQIQNAPAHVHDGCG